MRSWVMGEFASEDRLLTAVRTLRAGGFRRLDAHTPFPVEGLDEALELPPSRIAWVTLLFGLGGALAGYGIQWFCNAIDWPLNVGGRPPNSALSFVPITFETAVLSASCGTFFGLMALFGFPRVTHPVFDLDAFRSASVDRFWVSLATEDGEVRSRAVGALQELGAESVSVVEQPV